MDVDYVFWESNTPEKVPVRAKIQSLLLSWVNVFRNGIIYAQTSYLLDQGWCTIIMPRLISEINLEIDLWHSSQDKSRRLISARLISEINLKINLGDLVGLIFVMMRAAWGVHSRYMLRSGKYVI